MTSIFEEIVREIEVTIGTGYEVRHMTTIKNNGIKLDGISIKLNKDEVAPVIYINDYISKDLSPWRIANEVVNTYRDICGTTRKVKSEISDFEVFDKVKDKLRIRLINKGNNTVTLKDMPYEDFLDLAIIVVAELNSEMSMKVNDSMLGLWGVPFYEVRRIAKANLYKEMKFGHISEFLNMPLDFVPMYTITNRENNFGAAMITSMEIMDDVVAKIGDDLIIIPSSVHECFAIPASQTDLLNIAEAITEVNREVLKPEEILSNHPYMYKKRTGWEVK